MLAVFEQVFFFFNWFSILSFVGGLVCFSLRYNEVDDYKPKMTELEKAGIWEKLSSKKISYFESKDLPSDAFGFVYKVLKKWACNKHFNNFIVITT